MKLNLSEITFSYDFFSIPLPDGNTLVLNNVNENFITYVDNNNGIDGQSDDIDEIVVNSINIVVSTDDYVVKCSSVIGIGNEYFTLMSDYSEVLGKTLNTDNMKYCYLEIPDNE